MDETTKCRREGLQVVSSFSADRQTLLTNSVRPLVLHIATPSLAAMLAQGVCTLLDALYLSTSAPAVSSAVSVCFPLLTAQQTVGFTLGMGAGSRMSRALGQGSRGHAQEAASAALLLAIVLGLLLLACGFLFLHPLLAALGADDDVLPHAAAYANMLLLSAPAACTSLVLASLLRAQGKTPAIMLAYTASSAVGAALGCVLVVHAGLGAWGAGVSLLVRELLALTLLAVCTARAENIVKPSFRFSSLRKPVLSAIAKNGLPTLLRQGAASLSLAMSTRIAAGFGAPVLAGAGIAARAGALITSAAIGFGQGFQPVCGVNFGAGKTERVREAYRFCLRVIMVSLGIVGAVCFFCSDALLSVFHAEAEVAAVASQFLRTQSVVFFAQGAVIMMNMLTQSIGMTARAALVATSRQGIFLIPLLLTLPRLFGLGGFILCQSIADVLALLFSWCVARKAAAIDKAVPRD